MYINALYIVQNDYLQYTTYIFVTESMWTH